MEKMSKHDVGGLYDIRAIAKSKQFKEQKNYYDPHQAEKEFSDISSRKILFSSNNKLVDFIKVRSFDVVNFVAYGGAHATLKYPNPLCYFTYSVGLRLALCACFGLKVGPRAG